LDANSPKSPRRKVFTVNSPQTVLILVFLYGLIHSALASQWTKRKVRHLVGENGDRFYRLAFNAISVITLLPILIFLGAHPGNILYRIPSPWPLLTVAGQGVALIMLLIGLTHTDPLRFLGLRQIMGPGEAQEEELVLHGLYRWVRHPLYTAGLMFIWLTPIMTSSLLALNVGLTVYIYVGSMFEERRLQTEFGQAYNDYRHLVPRLIPTPWRKSRLHLK
jgi:protein-S-isoprenylcysteine O-methyltransferase Ste14